MPYYDGEVEKIGIFEASEAQKNAIQDEITHQIKVILKDGPGKWVSVKMVKKNPKFDLVWQRKDGDEYITIFEGAKIVFSYTVNGEYWSIDKKTIIIKENGTIKPKSYAYHKAAKGSEKPSYQKKNYTGVEVGHAINCGLLLAKHSLKDISGILENSKNMHIVTKDLKKMYREKFSDMSDYDLGAMVGHGVLNACRIGGNSETIKKSAIIIIDNIVPPITEFIKGGAEKPKDHQEEKPIDKQEKTKEEPQGDQEAPW